MTTHAQEFIGYVKKADSTSSPIFQAKVEITEGDKPFKSLKTYFDGSFKFLPNKNQSYSVKITYSGYTDTTYTVISDKNGRIDVPSITVSLKKDGMRLMGVIKSREEDFPIKGATIVLKNVMTRKEDRITTDIDGRYNFKLEYETNYKVWLDKRSPGIFNLYKDTSFYVSTIGFNQPLDYQLDISLDAMPLPLTPAREGYDAIKQHVNKNIKPVAIAPNEEKPQVIPPNDTSIVLESNTRKDDKEAVKERNEKLKNIAVESPHAPEPTKQLKGKSEVTKNKEEGQKTPLDSIAATAAEEKIKIRRGKEKLEVVIIRDTVHKPSTNAQVADDKVPSLSELEIVRQKALAEKKAREIETQIAIKKAAEERKRVELIAIHKAEEEQLAALQKLKNDSLLRSKHKNDSLILANTQKQKMRADSVSRAKDPLQRKVGNDSVAGTKTFYLTKTQEELVAAAEMFAKRKKFVEDSIAKSKGSEPKKVVDPKKDK